MAERIQRLMMATVLATGLILNANGLSWGLYLNWFVIIMVAVWGITGFCPFIAILKVLGVPSEDNSRAKCVDRKKTSNYGWLLNFVKKYG